MGRRVIRGGIVALLLGGIVGAIIIIAPRWALTADEGGTAPSELNKGVIEDGHDVYVENCSACHGKAGKGDGVMRSFLTIKPPDLTQIAKRNNGTFDFWKVYNTIDGTHVLRAHGESEMPVWGVRFKNQWGIPNTHARYLLLVFYLQSIQEK